VAGVDPNLVVVRHEDGQVERSVRSVEMAGNERTGLGVHGEAVAGRGGQGRLRVAEPAAAVVGEDGEAVAAAIEDDQVVAAVAGEVARSEADRLLLGADS